MSSSPCFKEEKTMDEIINGDAYELIKSIPDKSVDLIVTDHPYEFGSGHSTWLFKTRMKGRTAYDEITDRGLNKGVDAKRILPELKRVMKRTNIYLWCNKDQIKPYLDFFLGCNFEFIIWGKSNPPPFVGGHYLKDKEYCLYFLEQGVKNHITCERVRTVYMSKTNVEGKKSYDHPTIKPLPIIENLILNSSDQGGVILDPFSGSGTTCVAAKELGRHYIGFEIDRRYWEISQSRLAGAKEIREEGDSVIEQMSLF